MLFAFVLLSVTSLALCANPGDLKVSVQAVHSEVKSIEDIVISAVVSNPTDTDIRVLAKNNILDTSATRSFGVTKDGKSALFTGIRGTYDLSYDNLYTTIPAKSSIAVNHTGLSALYDFESLGAGTFSFTPNSYFQTGPTEEVARVSVQPIKIKVTSDVAKRELVSLSRRQSTPTCGDGNRLRIMQNALADARALAGGAATDVQSHPSSSEKTTYMGGNDVNAVWYRLDIIAGDLPSSGTRKIACAQDPAGICGPSSGVIAYTLLVTSGGQIVGSDIYLCDIFFTAVGTSPGICSGGYDSTTSSQGGVILHELSHATSGTNDIIYGCSNCARLSDSDKFNNADNFRCIGEAVYLHYRC